MFFHVKNSKIIKTIKELAYKLPIDNIEWIGIDELSKKPHSKLLEILMTTCLLANKDILKSIHVQWADKTLFEWYEQQMGLIGSNIDPSYWTKPLFPII